MELQKYRFRKMSIPVSQQFAIGIDIGGTTSKFGIVDTHGDISHSGVIPTRGYADVHGFIDTLYEAILPSIEAVGGREYIKGIGFGVPNGNYYQGTIEYAPNLPWTGLVPLAQLIQDKFQIPASLTNDANAAAVGEMTYGAVKGIKDFIMITLGTGVGSGIVIDGKIVYGHDGFAGELGHTIIIPGGRKHWSTGFEGSLEAYASATGVKVTAIEFLKDEKYADSLLHQFAEDQIDSKLIFEYAEKGDTLCQDVFAFTAKILGMSLANFVMFSSPEVIVLFGGLMKAKKYLLDATKLHMEHYLLPIFQNKVRIIPSELRESDAAILGASALVWDNKTKI